MVEDSKDLVTTPKQAPLVMDRRRFQSEDVLDPVALAQMPQEACDALVHARPQAEFAVAPVLDPESAAAIQAAIEEFDIVPPRGWLLVFQMPAAERLGHVLMPEVVTAEKKPDMGIVIAVGAGVVSDGKEIPPDMAIGHHVTFPSFCGVELKFGGVKLLQIRQDEIMMISRRPGVTKDAMNKQQQESVDRAQESNTPEHPLQPGEKIEPLKPFFPSEETDGKSK